MTDVKFYEARKKEAKEAYKGAILFGQFTRDNQLDQEDAEQMAKAMAQHSARLVRDGTTKEDYFAFYYAFFQWNNEKMPYYRVYPAFQKQLASLGEDFLNNLNSFDFDIDKSLKAIAVEFPITDEPTHVCELTAALKKGPKHTAKQHDLYMYLNIWYKENGMDKHVTNTLHVAFGPNDRGDTFEKGYDGPDAPPPEMISKTLRTYAAIIAIGDNPDLLKPIPLTRDRDKYEKTLDPKLIEKARRRGKFGFEVGKILEDEERLNENLKKAGGTIAPHYRKSHLAWQPHGPGNSLRKLILKKGSHVNFEKAKEVPMGYYDKKEESPK